MDEELEKEIDDAGREAVFARARANGWSVDNPPPKWVWQGLCHEVRRSYSSPQQPPPSLSEAIFGFRLF